MTPEQIEATSAICGAHYSDECRACVAARETNDARLASQPVPAPDLVGDRICGECHAENPCWFAPNELWNLVMGGPDATDDPGGVVCPRCFILKAQEQGHGVMMVALEATAIRERNGSD